MFWFWNQRVCGGDHDGVDLLQGVEGLEGNILGWVLDTDLMVVLFEDTVLGQPSEVAKKVSQNLGREAS